MLRIQRNANNLVYNAGGKHPCRRVGLAKTRDFKTVARIAPLTDPEISDANVIFPCANPVIDGVMHIYYGAADTYVGLATVPVADLLAHVQDNRE